MVLLSFQTKFERKEMAYFDRFDICEAYLAIEMDWNEGGFVDGKSYSSQLIKIGFKASPLFKGFKSLSENGKEIYLEKIKKLDFYKLLTDNVRLEMEGFYDQI